MIRSTQRFRISSGTIDSGTGEAARFRHHPLRVAPDRDDESVLIHMRIPRLVALAAALLMAAPGVARAQPGPGPGPGQQPELQVLRESEQQPLERLMAVRNELQLTDPQVARLRQIAGRLEETNRPLRRQLFAEYQRWRAQRRDELERMTPAERAAEMRRVQENGPPPPPESLRPLINRIRGNMRMAVREAGGVLTPAQRARARELVRERQAERRMGGQGMGRHPRFGGGRMRGGRP